MDIHRWARESVQQIRSEGAAGVATSLRGPWYKLLRHLDGKVNSGQNIFSYDWDVAIVIDACRADLFSDTASEYDYIENVNSVTSVASMTPNWMDRTFVHEIQKKLSNTIYICGSPYSYKHADARRFNKLYEPWKDDWSDAEGTLPARPVTDQAIHVARKSDFDRLLIHYMQPHFPFIGGDSIGDGIDAENIGHGGMTPWRMLELRHTDKDTVWEAYQNNLRYVLNDIEILVNNLTANSVVITSDHGNAIGEWGVYGHPQKIPINVLRRVPWAKVTAADMGRYEPDIK